MSKKIEGFLILQMSFLNLVALFLIVYFISSMATSTSSKLMDGLNAEVIVNTDE